MRLANHYADASAPDGMIAVEHGQTVAMTCVAPKSGYASLVGMIPCVPGVGNGPVHRATLP